MMLSPHQTTVCSQGLTVDTYFWRNITWSDEAVSHNDNMTIMMNDMFGGEKGKFQNLRTPSQMS